MDEEGHFRRNRVFKAIERGGTRFAKAARDRFKRAIFVANNAFGGKRMANIRPINDKILVKRLEAESTTKGGIVLPDSAKEKPKEGRVLAVGAGRVLDSGERAAFQVKKDDRVIFSSYAGTEVKLEGEEYLILEEGDILAIVT
jgi:chaperonin GroES